MPDIAPRSRRKPESPDARRRRLLAQEVALADRQHRAETARAAISGAPPRDRAHVKPLSRIEDDEQRLAVFRARVERLEAQLDQTERRRETRARIVLGSTVLKAAMDDPDDPLLARLLEIVDRGVHRPRDRQALAETLGLDIAAVKTRPVPALPDFEAMAQARLAREADPAEAKPGPGRRKKGA